MSDKPIDLARRRKLLVRMSALEKQMKELRKEFSTPEQLQKFVLGEIDSLDRGFKRLADSFRISQAWLQEIVILWGVYLKLKGHKPDAAAALACATKDTTYAEDAFEAAVLKRLAELEDELVS